MNIGYAPHKEKYVCFENLECGDVFRYKNDIYIKIEKCEGWCAIRIKDWDLTCDIEDGELVEKMEADLTIYSI